MRIDTGVKRNIIDRANSVFGKNYGIYKNNI